jgi:hypothetical protein
LVGPHEGIAVFIQPVQKGFCSAINPTGRASRRFKLNLSMPRPCIWVADSPERLSFVKYLVEKLDYDWITDRLGETHEPPGQTDLIVISDERYFSWLTEKIPQWREKGLPVLHVADGICEWRNIFDNPTFDRGDFPAAPLYQPLWADKVACLGRCQARILESLGNAGKTEVVGLPRLDHVQKRPARKLPPIMKICVTSARNPAFTPEQRKQCLRSLHDLNEWFKHVGATLPRAIMPLWRLPEEYAKKIGVHNTSSDMSGQTILETLQECDALVSTASTVLLEGMLLGLPCAILDYYHTPLYLDAAWRISAQDHLHDTLLEILIPPANKLIFQSYVLQDNLECRSPALPRMQRLIEGMIEIGRQSRSTGKPLSFSNRILVDEETPYSPPGASLGALFPQISALQESDPAKLQIQLIQAQRLASERLGRCLQLEEKLRQQGQNIDGVDHI